MIYVDVSFGEPKTAQLQKESIRGKLIGGEKNGKKNVKIMEENKQTEARKERKRAERKR